ncbi:MAG: hypothetical protein GX922_05300 [Firmicutes bacterium]|nr:hypothetical protein [Bacillota bacterium]
MDGNCIEKEFVTRTLHILKHYDGPYGVTLLVNCLLGLIVLPKEKDFGHIMEEEKLRFSDLGINAEAINWGEIKEEEQNATRFLRCLRNSVAHLKIESLSKEGEIEALRFSDQCGFEAVLKIEQLKKMLERFAAYLEKEG